jgi:hypothetical protein
MHIYTQRDKLTVFTKVQEQYRSGGEYLLLINRVHATRVHQQLQHIVVRTLRFHTHMKQTAAYHQPFTMSFIMYLCFEKGKAI